MGAIRKGFVVYKEFWKQKTFVTVLIKWLIVLIPSTFGSPRTSVNETCSVFLRFIGAPWTLNQWSRTHQIKNQQRVTLTFCRHNKDMQGLTHLLLEKDVESQNGQEAEVGWHCRPVGLLWENKQRKVSNDIVRLEENNDILKCNCTTI